MRNNERKEERNINHSLSLNFILLGQEAWVILLYIINNDLIKRVLYNWHEANNIGAFCYYHLLTGYYYSYLFVYFFYRVMKSSMTMWFCLVLVNRKFKTSNDI
jgi:hypothetical protein